MITDCIIAHIPVIESCVLPKEQLSRLNKEHKELLQSIRAEPLGTERIRAFDMSMNILGDSLGLQGDNRVSIKDFNLPHILIHNHADSAPISPGDFTSFIRRPNTLSIQAVGHDGSVSILERLPDYDAAGAIHKFIDILETISAALSSGAGSSDISFIVDKFLKSLSENGFTYRRW